jgi:DNA-binding FadR family transcriptional regulator
MHAEPSRITRNITEHAAILDALRQAGPAEAEEAVARHLVRVNILARGEA